MYNKMRHKEVYLSTSALRNFMGEDLDSLSLKELQNLEQQLDNSLKSTRIRKVNSAFFKFLVVPIV